MRGRKPKPTALKLMQGNPGKRKLKKDEPAAPRDLPDCPAWLDPDAKGEWSSIIPELSKMGLLSSIDKAALAGYCQAYADLSQAVKTLRKDGVTIETDKGNIIQHPAVGMKNRAMMIMVRFLSEFGLSPVSRSRLSKQDAPAEDDMEKFLNGAGNSAAPPAP